MPETTAVAEPAITIAICTHNNCEVLDGALASLFGMRMPLEATGEVERKIGLAIRIWRSITSNEP